MNAVTAVVATNGYWENRTTTDTLTCPFCGQRVEHIGYYDLGTYRCPACNAKAIRAVRKGRATYTTFRRYAQHSPPFSGLELDGAERLPANEVAGCRLRLLTPNEDICPTCGQKMELVIWRIERCGSTSHRSYTYCQPCRYAAKVWLA